VQQESSRKVSCFMLAALDLSPPVKPSKLHSSPSQVQGLHYILNWNFSFRIFDQNCRIHSSRKNKFLLIWKTKVETTLSFSTVGIFST